MLTLPAFLQPVRLAASPTTLDRLTINTLTSTADKLGACHRGETRRQGVSESAP
ncbi:hypothetical protein EDWATA_02435 [Edwardsiella tarda ATCC 23685]|uniref:Uncharacterized protein n=1 Tax=Edwardsiella tarda ATCC 23685 TaxID=500638 RepID=D4F6Q1_EDWTA|nr:hypothetical protein EDWATA_02435 [Edwardsiella tarda ATCC 23685]